MTVVAWNDHLQEARLWVDQRFPHYAHQISPESTLDDFLATLCVVPFEQLIVQGKEVDAVYRDRESVIQVHAGRLGTLPYDERTAILIHEAVEGYGIDTRLFSGYGFGQGGPWHNYAEFVETHFREERKLPVCRFALDQQIWERIEKMDQFFRQFPIWELYLGDTLDKLLREETDVRLDDQFKERVLWLSPY
ncbi:hypothetical protein HY488_01560 [Candidatus Woesearchaeota archaeon]|nr:hypothetical protein [Candidatus Woesearchaeota archaeon]